MTVIFTMPSTLDDAQDQLAALDQVATATGWHRAAIVYAFVTPDAGNGGRPQALGSERLSCKAFARLGIAGLRADGTVAHYQRCWQLAVDQGLAEPTMPGAQVVLPDIPWPPADVRSNRHVDAEAIRTQAAVDGLPTGSKALDVASNTRSMAAAIKASPDVAAAAREALRERDRLDDATTQATIDQVARRAGRAVEQALGVDPVASHLRAAAAEVGQAILELDLSGVSDEEQVRKALATLDRYRAMFRSNTSWSDEDRAFLADYGVQL